MKKTTHSDPSKPPAMSIAEAYDQADRESVKRQIANLDRLIAKRENEKGLPAEDNGHSTENLRGAPPVDLPDLDPARLNEEARGVWLWERGELVLDVVDGRLETFNTAGRLISDSFPPFAVMSKARKLRDLPPGK